MYLQYNFQFLMTKYEVNVAMKDVFIYHLDNELFKLFSLGKYDNAYLYSHLKAITRVAFLICNNKILIPASNYFESDLSFKILNELTELNDIGAIDLISSSHNIDELLAKKTSQHGDNIGLANYHYKDFINNERIILPGTLKKRSRSASVDIKTGWYSWINTSATKNQIFELSSNTTKASMLEDCLYEVPRKLGNKAYISEYILPLLPIDNEKEKNADYLLNVFITREYISSFLKEFDAVCLKDLPIIDSNSILPYNINDGSIYISYQKIATALKMNTYKNKNAFEYICNCNGYELIEFKNSTIWQSILNMSINEKTSLNNIKEKDMDDYSDIKIGIITALPKECAAVKMMLDNVKECFFNEKGAGHRFFIGTLKSANGNRQRVALAQCGMGNNKAAIRATNMINHFKSIDSIIMTGIAGGIPSYQSDDKQVRLGDIVISTGVVQYDFTKESIECTEIRSEQPQPSAMLLEAVNVLKTYEYENTYPWHEYIDQYSQNPIFSKPSADSDLLYDEEDKLCEHPNDPTRTQYPKVFYSKIASANNLLKNPQKRNMLKSKYGVLAAEMEASGIADASWNHSVGYLVVRGICDYCDIHKNDLWQEYAALVAAAYTKSLIEMLPSF